MPRKRNGPAAFMLSVGAVLSLFGLLTFLAVPAARELDRKASVEDGSEPSGSREGSVVRGAALTTAFGAALAGIGWALVRKRR